MDVDGAVGPCLLEYQLVEGSQEFVGSSMGAFLPLSLAQDALNLFLLHMFKRFSLLENG